MWGGRYRPRVEGREGIARCGGKGVVRMVVKNGVTGDIFWANKAENVMASRGYRVGQGYLDTGKSRGKAHRVFVKAGFI